MRWWGITTDDIALEDKANERTSLGESIADAISSIASSGNIVDISVVLVGQRNGYRESDERRRYLRKVHIYMQPGQR